MLGQSAVTVECLKLLIILGFRRLRRHCDVQVIDVEVVVNHIHG